MGYIYTNHKDGVLAQVRISAVAYLTKNTWLRFRGYNGYIPAAEQRTAAIAELMIEHQGVALTALIQLGMTVDAKSVGTTVKCNKCISYEM